MSILLETVFGDVVIDLQVPSDVQPQTTTTTTALLQNVCKLTTARKYTQSLIYQVATTMVPTPTPHTNNTDSLPVVQRITYCTFGCPYGDGTGGACIFGYLDSHDQAQQQQQQQQQMCSNTAAEQSKYRFLKTPKPCDDDTTFVWKPGMVVAMELNGIPHTIGSQVSIVLKVESSKNNNTDETTATLLSNQQPSALLPQCVVGTIVEDESNVLDKIATTYLDLETDQQQQQQQQTIKGNYQGRRPLADIRIQRALIVDDPYPDPKGMTVDFLQTCCQLELERREQLRKDDNNNNDETVCNNLSQMYRVVSSPSPERPPLERVPVRISASELDEEFENDDDDDNVHDPEKKRRQVEREQEIERKQDYGRAVVLEMLGDLPSADIQTPENVLFLCKLNPITVAEDLELIFSRFDPNVRVDVICDTKTGQSLQYAFATFSNNQQAVEAYLKMNNALIDDRRIKVDFSQSVATIWDKYNQRMKQPKHSSQAIDMPHYRPDGGGRGSGRGGGRGFGPGRGGRGRGRNDRRDGPHRYNHRDDREREDDRRRNRDDYPRSESPKGSYDRDRVYDRRHSPPRERGQHHRHDDRHFRRHDEHERDDDRRHGDYRRREDEEERRRRRDHSDDDSDSRRRRKRHRKLDRSHRESDDEGSHDRRERHTHRKKHKKKKKHRHRSDSDHEDDRDRRRKEEKRSRHDKDRHRLREHKESRRSRSHSR